MAEAGQQDANTGYAWEMLGAMAELGYGPLHSGAAVAVAGEVEFESIMLVYYPGVRFFSMLLQSEFFQNIIGDKQLGDYQATVTVPVLDKL